MSQMRKYRRGLSPRNVKTAKACGLMLKHTNGSFKELKKDFVNVFEKTFIQTTKEVFAPANNGGSTEVFAPGGSSPTTEVFEPARTQEVASGVAGEIAPPGLGH